MINLAIVEYQACYGDAILRLLAKPKNQWFAGYMLLTNSAMLMAFIRREPACEPDVAEALAMFACEHFKSEYGASIIGEATQSQPCKQVIYCIYDKRSKKAVSLKKISNQDGLTDTDFHAFIAQKIYDDFLDR
jgi:hypothetical protein